jgi:hypothetical protein
MLQAAVEAITLERNDELSELFESHHVHEEEAEPA